ncbi:MAG: single-stranded DNA-binding protein [Thermoanaerobaculales bacterium]|jgi:single-strand DNA-binding protein|nr:single-stranded DNA-binding protein [Thermoanaerobaculales bacterium]
MGINKVILVGNVGRDPEIKSLPSGTRLATFSLATTDRRSKDEHGNPRTEWHNLVAWGKLADVVEQYVTKGKQLYVEGQIRTRSWEPEPGQKKYFTEIHIQEMELLGGRPAGDHGGGSSRDPGPGNGFPDDVDDVPF